MFVARGFNPWKEMFIYIFLARRANEMVSEAIMAELTIVAHITARPDKIELVKAELMKLIDVTRSESGCVQYDLHQDNERPAHFMFFENWDWRTVAETHGRPALVANEGRNGRRD